MTFSNSAIQREYDDKITGKKPVFYCEDCGVPLYIDDEFVDLWGDRYCEDCAQKIIKKQTKTINQNDVDAEF